MTVIYPKTIQTTTGHSIKYATQKLTNPNNLCSSSTSLAYWGVKNPTYYGVYLRNYPDSVTTASGSFHTPETFYAVNWNLDNIPDNAVVTNLTIEYKWEQISYSCGTSDCYGKFDRPTITLIAKGKNLTTFKGAKPDAIRYANNNTNTSKMNTNSAQLSTLHSHPITNIGKYNLTIADLKKMKIKFKPAKNTATNYCRIVMQFIRIKIDYKKVDVNPIYRIAKSSLSPQEVKLKNNESEAYTYSCTIKNTTSSVKKTNCTVMPLQDDIIINPNTIQCIPASSGNTYDPKTKIWSINTFSKNQATLSFKAYSKQVGTKEIKTTINAYADSIDKEKIDSVNVIEAPNNVTWNIGFVNEDLQNEQYIFDSTQKEIRKSLRIKINRDQDQEDKNEKIIIDTHGWITDADQWHYWTDSDIQISPTERENGIWEFNNIRGNEIIITTEKNGVAPILPPGEYKITVSHSEKNRFTETKSIYVYVIDEALPTDYFKLRLEDGSDIRYNSLIFTVGDDLNKELTYDFIEDNIDYINIHGENKHIPTNEARYITYTLKSDKDIENAICKIDIKNDETGENCSDILIAGDNQVVLKNGYNDKFCIIDKLNANEEKKIKFIVQSNDEQNCTFKLKYLNYDEYETGKWTPAHIFFRDMPSIKLSIESDIDDLSTPDNDVVNIYYHIENKSVTSGKNLKFYIKEPSSFNIEGDPKYTIYEKDNKYNVEEPYFNEHNRILTIPEYPGAQYNDNTDQFETYHYILKITYKATKKGIFDFTLQTFDDDNTTEDDQWINSVTKKIMVNISSNTIIKTFVTKQRPYINELIDFTINVKNYIKKQNHFKFIVKDIGSYQINHDKNDYLIEYHTTTKGLVTNNNENNQIAIWDLENIDINEENELVLSIRPQELGQHVIETTFIDSDGEIQKFENLVNVLEPNKKLQFNAYHAISTNDLANCQNCDSLTEICDNDFINLDDELYYVCEIKNNDHNDINTTTHLYARLDDSLLENDILCSSHHIDIDETNLLHIKIPNIRGCSSIKVCFKIQPAKIGTFISNFMITNRNAHVYHKDLTINVDTNFNQRQMEHEINIYNFEKTHKYFRYELDSENNIFKFYNQGNDKTIRPIQVEEYKKSSIETYKGTNLKKIVRDIANNSKYVEPELLRIGNNKLMPKGYELYPDGFMRRFGLLNSEVFHYTGQLPIVSHLVDKAMRWDIDPWNLKVWGGDIYDNGVFDLSIDYSKIPTNFNILELDNPIQNLQALVDKTKPYGTQAICYYYTKIYLDLKMKMNLNYFEVNNIFNIPLHIKDHIGLISLYNRHDNSLAAYYDLFYHKLNTDIDVSTYATMKEILDSSGELQSKPFNNFNLNTNIDVGVEKYDQQYFKRYISECFDIVQNIYSYNSNLKNISIIKKNNYNNQGSTRGTTFTLNDNKNYTIELNNPFVCSIFIDEEEFCINYKNDKINKFIGFVIKSATNTLFKSNFYTDIHKVLLNIQHTTMNDKQIIHIFCSINDEDFVHIGYLTANENATIIISPQNIISSSYSTEEELIYFKIQDTVQTTIENPDTVVQFNNKNKWNNIENIRKEKGYAVIENNNDVSKECDIQYIQTPTLALKYNNINISNNDEIIDIGFQLKAKTNKENFTDDIKINLYKDGDYYIPENNIEKRTYHPHKIDNINPEYINDLIIQQPNITICSSCMKTALGIYDECPYCGSHKVSAYDQKKAVTICRNIEECGWITDGWYDYCPHCLSKDIEKTKVDFNKTVCNDGDCGHIENDYYPACVKCGSKNIIHLNNDETKFSIKDKNSQNIEEVIIKSNINRVNLFNIDANNEMLKSNIQNLEYLQLHIYGNNYNQGKFYYCPSCNHVELGNSEACSKCHSTDIQNFDFNNTTMDIYYQSGSYIQKIDEDTTYDQLKDEFDISINMLDLIEKTNTPNFKLLIYAENLYYDDIYLQIEKIKNKISDKDYQMLIKNILSMDVSIKNIYYDYNFRNENEWGGLNNIQGNSHTGIKYIVDREEETKYISFYDFNINNDKYEHLYLNIAGINKADKYIDLNINVIDQDNKSWTTTIKNITPDLFSNSIDILSFAETKRIKNMKVNINFSNVERRTEIIITHLSLTTEKERKKKILKSDLIQHNYDIEFEQDTYIVATNNLFDLNKEVPYYTDGRQLNTNLVAFFDFGKLQNEEYIRLYNIKIVVLYKNRYGKLSTEYITIDDDKYTKQLINGNIQKNNTEIWGSIKTPINTLNNLEYEIINNDNEKTLQSIPLKYELIQGFSNNIGNLGQIRINYDGRVGYPSDIIILQVFDDYQNYPDHLLFEKEIIMPTTSAIIDVDVGLDDLDDGQYWFKLIDHSANENNYHRFYYNDNVSVGNLIIINNKEEKPDNIVLSFGVDADLTSRQYYSLPTSLDIEGVNNFKTNNTFYRYNTKSVNNGYLSNLQIETGYLYYSDSNIENIDDIITTNSEDDNDENEYGS